MRNILRVIDDDLCTLAHPIRGDRRSSNHVDDMALASGFTI